jgi:hypothetical protein
MIYTFYHNHAIGIANTTASVVRRPIGSSPHDIRARAASSSTEFNRRRFNRRRFNRRRFSCLHHITAWVSGLIHCERVAM